MQPQILFSNRRFWALRVPGSTAGRVRQRSPKSSQCWVDSVKSVTSHDFLTQSSQVTSHAAPVDSVKSRCRAVTVTE